MCNVYAFEKCNVYALQKCNGYAIEKCNCNTFVLSVRWKEDLLCSDGIREACSRQFLWNSSDLHGKTKTQILRQPNPESKGKKNIFGAHFETYLKPRFVAS